MKMVKLKEWLIIINKFGTKNIFKKTRYLLYHTYVLRIKFIKRIKIISSIENTYINEYGVKKNGKLTNMIPSEYKDQYITISIGNTTNEYSYQLIEQDYGVFFEDSLDFDYDYNDLTVSVKEYILNKNNKTIFLDQYVCMQFRTGADDLDLLDYTDYPDEINDGVIFKDCKKLIPPMGHEYACLENYPIITNVKRYFDKKYNHEIMKLGIMLKDRIIELGDTIKHGIVKVFKI